MALLAGVIWHWWISVALVAGSAALVIATIVGYVMKVILPKYPRK